MTEQNPAPSKPVTPAYYVYLGKRISKGQSKLVDAYIESDETGKQIEPKEEGYYWASKKFPYAKRPAVGAIYMVKMTSETAYLIEPDFVRYHGQIQEPSLLQEWELEHKMAQGMDAKRLIMNKGLNKDALKNMTLGEIQAKMRTSNAAQRQALLGLIIHYIQV